MQREQLTRVGLGAPLGDAVGVRRMLDRMSRHHEALGVALNAGTLFVVVRRGDEAGPTEAGPLGVAVEMLALVGGGAGGAPEVERSDGAEPEAGSDRVAELAEEGEPPLAAVGPEPAQIAEGSRRPAVTCNATLSMSGRCPTMRSQSIGPEKSASMCV